MRSNTARYSPLAIDIRSLHFARDTVDEVGNALSIHPDIDRSTLPELWRENLRKREQKKPPAKKPEDKRHPVSDHRIDDFA